MQAAWRVALVLAGLLAWECVDAPRVHANEPTQPAEASTDTDRHGLWAEFGHARQKVFGNLGGADAWYWDQGPNFDGPKDNLTFHIGGEVQYDLVWYSDPGAGVKQATGNAWQSGAGLRRARVLAEGTILRHWYFRVRYDLRPDAFAAFQDAYVEWMGLVDRFGTIAPRLRFGQTREPIGLDALTAARFTTFLERAMPVDAIAPMRNLGLRAMASLKSERATFWLGAFAINAAGLGDAAWDDGAAVSTRITGLPWAPRGCDCRFLHLGLSASWRFQVGSARYQALPETHLGGEIVDTGSIDVDNAGIGAAELAFVYDRFSLQGEYLFTRVSQKSGDTAYLHGGYAQVSWFLTPPCRRFVRRTAVFGRITPCRDVTKGGRGGWEVAARLSYLDLDDGQVAGGTATSATFGINWYLSPYLRITANYVHCSVENAFGDPAGDGTLNQLALRFQIDG